MDINLRNAYLRQKDAINDSYNYNIFSMISSFDFYEFCDSVKKKDYDNNGAMLVITDKQYVLCYNKSFGRGTHEACQARIYKELHGGGAILTDEEAMRLFRNCKQEYLTARIMYESVYFNSRLPLFEGSMVFDFVDSIKEQKNRTITMGMAETFKKFYNDYNEDIKLICKKFKFKVIFIYLDGSKVVRDESNSLDNLYNYIDSFVDEKKIVDSSEDIIGVPVNKNLSK